MQLNLGWMKGFRFAGKHNRSSVLSQDKKLICKPSQTTQIEQNNNGLYHWKRNQLFKN